jgi:hypothetical protein
MTLRPSSHKIFPWLLLANRDFAMSRATLREHQITHIVFCTTGGVGHFEDDGIAYYPVLFDDDEHSDLSLLFNKRMIKFINDGKSAGRVAIVSDRGLSRCVAAALYYLVPALNVSLRDAFGLIKDAHRKAKPNADFVAQLKLLLGEYPRANQPAAPQLLDAAPKNRTGFKPDQKNDSNAEHDNNDAVKNDAVDEKRDAKLLPTLTRQPTTDDNSDADDDNDKKTSPDDDNDSNSESEKQKIEYLYACRLCRHTIFRHSKIIPHSKMDGHSEHFEGKQFWNKYIFLI